MFRDDEDELWSLSDEPSEVDFEVAEEEIASAPRRSFVRYFRVVIALLVAVALLAYYVPPFRRVVTEVPLRWLRQQIAPIPVAPPRSTSPTLGV